MDSAGGALLPLTNELIAGVLDGHGYAFAQDADGDLVGRWDDNLIYFFRLGRGGEILQVRTLASRTFGIDDVLPLYTFCNGWNQDRLWPKAFVHVNDDGTVRVVGEVVADLEHGVTADQLDQILACGISSGCQLAETLERLKL
ncbi:YbjN domain-containing protein [Asanoa sp. WMMD1127]|uniref:YbjN domain-containing protein n=1 Tax=Asanoa sp. WMMD1127 TaxID=3016107 RepID=UPI0024174004|nr:YbjN domain-containing protein [Asanoa sp. WMMD1127]MDG4823683.1 YbjN domain-containing protein [Asanoa sp. WMMD1127]